MFLSGSPRRPWLPYLAVLLVFAAGAALRMFFFGVLSTRVPFVTLFPAVMVAVLFGGLPAGLVVTALSALLAVYCWIEPVGEFAVRNAPDWVALVIFLVSCIMVSCLGEVTRRAQRRAIEAEGELRLGLERERASAALYESESKFRSYVENAPTAVFVMDREGRCIDFNPAASALFGDSLGGKQLRDLHPEESHPDVLRHLTALFEKGRVELETRMLRADGEPVWVSLRAVLLDDGHAVGYCQDISEQKRAVQNLGERLALQERLAGIAATVPGVIHSFRLRPDGSSSMPYASPALEQLYGLRPAEVAGDATPLFALIHRDDLYRVQRSISDSACTLSPWRDEFRINHARRGEIWLEGQSVPQREADGGTLWQGFLHDVTARKLSEQALQDSSQFNRQIINGAEEGIVVYGTDLRYQVWNPYMERFTGIGASEILGRHPREVFPFLDESGVLERLEKALLGERSALEFANFSAYKGRTCWVSDNFAPLRSAKGEIIGVIGIVREITDRKEVEEELRGSEARFRTLVEQAADAFFVHGRDGRFLDVNRRACESLGYQREELLQLSVSDIEQDVDLEQIQQAWDRLPLGQHSTLRGHQRRKDGSVFPVEVRLGSYLQNGERRYLGLARDITEQCSLAAQLVQAQKMEAVGRLAGGVAHDFNNNLTVILGYAELSRLVAINGETFHEYLDQIIQAAEHSRDITQQLLAFSRNEIIAPRQVDLNQLIRTTDKTLSRLIGEDVQLRLTMPPGIWPILIDPSQLNQIIMNLAVNARDAMPAGGTLHVETRNLRLDEIYCLANSEARPGEYVQMTVSDTGIGMDPETLGHIFEPFYTTKGVGKGTGLGLATVYGIVSQNAGFIKVYSEPGKGAAFALFFPRLVQESDAPDQAAHPVASGEGSVLLVEDEANVRQMAQLMLRKAGYSVLVANSPPEALEICRRAEPGIDCLLTDVIMPEMNGVELSEAVGKLRPGIGVVFMSGYTSDMIAHHGVLAPEVTFLQKPFDMNSLHQKVQEAITRSRKS